MDYDNSLDFEFNQWDELVGNHLQFSKRIISF